MIRIIVFVLFFVVPCVALFAWVTWPTKRPAKRKPRSPYPRGPLPPERIRPDAGGCGITGCKNKRPHSHVEALRDQLRRK